MKNLNIINQNTFVWENNIEIVIFFIFIGLFFKINNYKLTESNWCDVISLYWFEFFFSVKYNIFICDIYKQNCYKCDYCK